MIVDGLEQPLTYKSGGFGSDLNAISPDRGGYDQDFVLHWMRVARSTRRAVGCRAVGCRAVGCRAIGC